MHHRGILTLMVTMPMHTLGELALFPEYEEMCIQFGFITCFVSAFPLGPVFALLNNLLEIRVDARKFCLQMRRPPPERVTDIGAWQQVLEVITFIGVLTNGAVIAFTGDFIDKLVYKYNHNHSLEGYISTLYPLSPLDPLNQTAANLRNCHYTGFYDDTGTHTSLFYQILMAKLAFFIVFEHAVFVTKILVNVWIPDVPESLRKARRRQAYFSRKLIDGIDEDVDMTAYASAQVESMGRDGLQLTLPQATSSARLLAADENGGSDSMMRRRGARTESTV